MWVKEGEGIVKDMYARVEREYNDQTVEPADEIVAVGDVEALEP